MTLVEKSAYERLLAVVQQSGLPFVLHEHVAARTIEEAAQHLPFEVGRIVKTVGFATRDGGIALAVLRGIRRVDYAALSRLLNVNRRDLATLSPADVQDRLGVEPGSVSPVPLSEQVTVLVDEDVLTISPTVYCGIGRADRTLETSPQDLVRLAGAQVAAFSK